MLPGSRPKSSFMPSGERAPGRASNGLCTGRAWLGVMLEAQPVDEGLVVNWYNYGLLFLGNYVTDHACCFHRALAPVHLLYKLQDVHQCSAPTGGGVISGIGFQSMYLS